ncbi:MAG: HAMP domain-containing histidine kinase [Selenomonas sp.]|uniref:sensor histidine kinase n=1 Tax=Selenomonas sp. TaxID=2053611 RepID=UPI0025CEB171|nr:HAMP domain-containing sensor histidine kinase [Selenomonas sp.]MCR5756824.1 HAMP domain-containing histidine kinase [Selenomonas sp.]
MIGPWRQIAGKNHFILPLRLYHSLSTLLTLGFCCGVSSILVTLLNNLAGLELELFTALIICSLMTVVMGALILAWEAGLYIRPAQAVMEATRQVSQGDFRVRVPMPETFLGIEEGVTLIENFNRMAKELESIDHLQKGFTGSVSHEFKTPLSSIVGFSEILLEDGLSEEERREYTGLVHEEALRLSRLAENLLRLSRLDAQAIVMRHETIGVDEQLRQCVILLAERWEAKQISFVMDLPALNIMGDADLTKQVWLNLIDNAVKYTEAGRTIHISGQLRQDCICVRIRDEGIGIPAEKLSHIFDRFYQCDESHKEKGHGLGLSIVKRILELLGGRIVCHSQLGQGTEMLVALPVDSSKVCLVQIPEE